jgi:hypothetical protein
LLLFFFDREEGDFCCFLGGELLEAGLLVGLLVTEEFVELAAMDDVIAAGIGANAEDGEGLVNVPGVIGRRPILQTGQF